MKVLILHGWGSCARNWQQVKELLENKEFSVFVPDLPGFGREPPPAAAWNVDNYVEWVKDYAEKNNLGRFFLFGHSFGGRIAIKFAAKYPEKLQGLILAAAAGVTPRPKIKIGIFQFFSKLGNLIFSLPFLVFLRSFARKLIYFVGGQHDYQFIQAPVMKEVFRLTIGENLTEYLSLIKTKTLIIWGDKDKLTPVSDAYLIKEKINDSVLEVFPGVGHRLRLEAPEILVEKISEFIK